LSIPIDLFESYIPEEELIDGENLYDLHAIKSFQWIGENLVSLSIQGDLVYEVELKTSKTLFQRVTCECKKYHTNKICAHIACSLFYYRAKLWRNSPNVADQSVAKRKQIRIKLDRIIDKITPEELSVFVRSYAKQDKNFALALKIRFLSKMSEEIDDESIYKVVLDQIIKPRNTKDFKYSAKDINTFKRTISEFYDQLQDKFSLQYYKQAFAILSVCLEKIYYLLAWQSAADKRIEEFRIKGLENITYLLKSDVSPEIRNDIFLFLKSLFCKSFFQVYSKPSSYLDILFRLAVEQERMDELLSDLKSKYAHENTSERSKLTLAVYIVLLENLLKQEEYNWILKESFEFNLKVIQALLARKQAKTAERLIKLNEKFRTRNTALLIDSWIQLFELKGKKSNIVKLALTRFKSTGKSHYYIKAKNVKLPAWENIKSKLESELHAELLLNEDKTIYRFYSLENEYHKMRDLIISQQDFEAMISYCHELLNLDELTFMQFITVIIDNEIENHAGNHLNTKISHFLQLLSRFEAYKIRRKIIFHIEKKYKYRSSLMKELSQF
jgi:hypothetical protein